jgi:hypothetical protein
MRLIIATNSAATGISARNALTAFLDARGWSVWHWYPDLWLIDGAPAGIDLAALRVEISRAIPALAQVLILTAEGPISHAGTVPGESADWFTTHWDRRR